MNPKEWREPKKFIPERFDFNSPYYLTPEIDGQPGKKRHPMSFGPFLGGKRVCLGKTFAENVVKSIIPIILTQVDFEVGPDSDIYGNEKPSLTFFSAQPLYRVDVKNLTINQ